MTESVKVVVFWISIVLCVIAEAAILRSVFSPQHLSQASGTPIPHAARSTEMLWGIIPAIALVLLLAATWRAAH